jgi:hypothetical protein
LRIGLAAGVHVFLIAGMDMPAAGEDTAVMSAELRHYLITEHAIGAAVVNFVLNAGIAWLLLGHLEFVPMWGQESIVGDTVGTIFILTALTCLITTRIVRWHVRTGKAPEGALPAGSWELVRKLPPGIGMRALVSAAAVTAVVAPIAVGLLLASGLDGIALRPFLVFKATFAALLAACIQPAVALRALMDRDPVELALPAPSET